MSAARVIAANRARISRNFAISRSSSFASPGWLARCAWCAVCGLRERGFSAPLVLHPVCIGPRRCRSEGTPAGLFALSMRRPGRVCAGQRERRGRTSGHDGPESRAPDRRPIDRCRRSTRVPPVVSAKTMRAREPPRFPRRFERCVDLALGEPRPIGFVAYAPPRAYGPTLRLHQSSPSAVTRLPSPRTSSYGLGTPKSTPIVRAAMVTACPPRDGVAPPTRERRARARSRGRRAYPGRGPS
jgi:hypothetical protein